MSFANQKLLKQSEKKCLWRLNSRVLCLHSHDVDVMHEDCIRLFSFVAHSLGLNSFQFTSGASRKNSINIQELFCGIINLDSDVNCITTSNKHQKDLSWSQMSVVEMWSCTIFCCTSFEAESTRETKLLGQIFKARIWGSLRRDSSESLWIVPRLQSRIFGIAESTSDDLINV